MNTEDLKNQIRQLAESGEIDVVGFADASPFKGYAWKQYKRRAPSLSMSEAKSIIIAGIYIGGLKLPVWDNPWYGRTRRLYLSGYFLDAVEPMQPIAAILRDVGYQALVCDESNAESSILPLKLAAVRAGLGWQGKHSLLISKKFGTFLALGEIITDAEFELNTSEERNRCRECDQCQKACPWNTRHIKRPLQTRLTSSFEREIETWESFFHLPKLMALTEKEYQDRLGHLNTDIPHAYFHRNVKIAMNRAKDKN
jgi:epoxyqueuosine reductase QueG